ncbi:AAA family ATPase [Streptomyces sp. NPDC059340]|uniref:AAA family ATPase n=1 Tax=Streptomyces sp. NPDC059340 TaxID=3346806 RepID=UPI003694776B
MGELVNQGKIDSDAVVSSDDIRTELFGPGVAGADSGSTEPQVFDERDRRIIDRLAAGRIAVAESTNVTPQARERLAAIAERFNAPVTMLRFAQGEAELFRQNEERARNDVSAADVGAYAAIMRRDASADQLHAEGAAFVTTFPDGAKESLPRKPPGDSRFCRPLSLTSQADPHPSLYQWPCRSEFTVPVRVADDTVGCEAKSLTAVGT